MLRTSTIRRYATAATKNGDYQLLQRSKIPMLHFQPSLPRLPIPKLEQTCERYLAALQPLLIDEAFRKTTDTVMRFQNGVGKDLQTLLKEHDAKNKHTSYISEPWFDMYLRDRVPLPINYNPLLVMKPDEKTAYNQPVVRVTNLVVSSLRFMRSLNGQMLEPEVFHMNPRKSDTDTFRNVLRLIPSSVSTYVAYAFKAFPLDMSQYEGLFAGTRIPEMGKDRISRSKNSRHIIVVKGGHFYAVDVLDADGNIETPDVLLTRISHLYKNANRQPNEHPIGVLTAENRDIWASLRHHLSDIGNDKALKQIDSALFCLCLDEVSTNKENPVPMVRNLLFGNAGNRWFDKSLSLIVGADGTAAVNFEHSWGDGVAVLRYFNEVYKDTTQNPHVHPDTKTADGHGVDAFVRHIDFKLDDRMKEGISAANKKHSAISDSLDMQSLIYESMNKKLCKQFGVSPDSIMQLGFQLAFYKQYGKYVATYESCSTAAFRHGRTETMRPCTMATKNFCEAARNWDGSKERAVQLVAMLLECSKTHGQLTKEAAMGQGFDRHLFGLRQTAEAKQLPKPAIFEDPSYALINHNILSTSTLSSPALEAGGFGPVVQNGYGIGYNIQDDRLGAIVTNYKEHRNGSDFIECLRDAFSTIEKILRSSSDK